ncbi:MAG TPA: DUF1223 domain-containing protein [Verrucomicrobiae bacterium]|jgi:hypothetical protein|nr:DUF1223 domain-containing protein [Verrucomicrobiae bacterium]
MYRSKVGLSLLCAVLGFGLVESKPEQATARGLPQTGQASAVSQTAGASKVPVLVELFTSEGCSSCPPADAFVAKMDSAQPVPGAELIVLSEHVDYWDHDGWKDPNSSPVMTQRQIAYVKELHLKEPYTPQIIVDGTSEMRANDQQQVSTVLNQAVAQSTVPIRIDEVKVDPKSPNVVRLRIDTDGNGQKDNADVYVAVALNHFASQVSRGENSGHELTSVAVVQDLSEIGTLHKGKAFDKNVTLKLKPGTDPNNVRIVAFLQQPGPSRVVGAAMQKLSD